MNYKINFDELNWDTPIKGVRHKIVDQEGTRIRLVEYTREMPLHWCCKGHAGYLLDGEMEIEYNSDKIIYKKGDGIYMPDGEEHKHKARVISEKAVVFFIEKV